jgi:hypothetical protein
MGWQLRWAHLPCAQAIYAKPVNVNEILKSEHESEKAKKRKSEKAKKRKSEKVKKRSEKRKAKSEKRKTKSYF